MRTCFVIAATVFALNGAEARAWGSAVHQTVGDWQDPANFKHSAIRIRCPKAAPVELDERRPLQDHCTVRLMRAT